MTTQLVDVKISRVEAEAGFLITCSGCPNVRIIYPNRPAADAYAAKHRAAHQRPEPEQDWL